MSSCGSQLDVAYVGPDEPLAQVGETRRSRINEFGAKLAIAHYKDGTVYQVQVRVGDRFDPGTFQQADLPDAVWMGAHPDNAGGLYMSFWVADDDN